MTITVKVSSLLRTRRYKEINYLGPVEEFLAIQLWQEILWACNAEKLLYNGAFSRFRGLLAAKEAT